MLLTGGAPQNCLEALTGPIPGFLSVSLGPGPGDVCSEQSHGWAGCVPLARNCCISSTLITSLLRFSTSHLFFTFLLCQELQRHAFLPSSIFSRIFLNLMEWGTGTFMTVTSAMQNGLCHLILKDFAEMAPKLEQHRRLDNVKTETCKVLRQIKSLHHQQRL